MGAVELRRGTLHVSGTALALDATRKCALSFVSHAHADHIARHERVIATGPTLRLLQHRLGEVRAALPVPYRRPFDLGPLSLELLPAGHVLGSAQLRITREDGVRVVYSGDLNLVPSLTAEAAQVAECDVLVLEATFGHPRYAFPEKRGVLAQVGEWVRSHLERGVTPVILGYALGKAQEAIAYLQSERFSVCAHRSVWEVSTLYRELGAPLEPVRRFDGHARPGEVLVVPPHVARTSAFRALWPRATAVLTGWAVEPGAARRYGADCAFALSDHADFAGLVDYACATGAREVLTHHGFAVELAEGLRARGLEARPVGTLKQMELFPALAPARLSSRRSRSRMRGRRVGAAAVPASGG
jgi:putative mRNA 3-end processing factor